MKVFLGFLIVCFFSGWLLHKLSLRVMTLLLLGFSAFIAAGYLYLNFIGIPR